jgi:ethanolamine transporter EutH
MARGPDGSEHAAGLSEADGLSPAELGFTQALERIIDRALLGHRAGGAFVYGIHQALSSRMIEVLTHRYLAAGWREAGIRESATGAYLLILRP